MPPYPYTVPTHKGGTITYALYFYPLDGANPWSTQYSEDFELTAALWDYPLGQGPDGKYLPDLLTEVPTQANGDVSKDGLTVTLRLRRGMRWSDGQPLTSMDFVYWLNMYRALFPDSTYINQFASYTAVDDHTLRLAYKQFYASFFDSLPYAAPQHAWGNYAPKDLLTKPDVNLSISVTNGPFMVSDYSAPTSTTQIFTLVPNPYYASTSFHASVLDKLILKVYDNFDSLLQDYRAGKINQVDDLRLEDLSKLKGMPGLRISPTMSYEHLDFNLDHNKYLDVNVRKAIEEAIGRCDLIKQVFSQQNCTNLTVDTILPKPSPDFDPTISTYKFNLNQAIADMKRSQWDCSGGTCMNNDQSFPTLQLATLNDSVSDQIAKLIQNDLKALGIQVDVQEYDAATYYGDFTQGGILTTGKFDLSLIVDLFSFDSDHNLYPIFDSQQIPTAQNPNGSNFGRVKDQNVDASLNEAKTELDPTTRHLDYQDVQRLIVQQVYLIPLFLLPNITLTSPNIGNYLPFPVFDANEWNVGDWFLKR